MKTTRSLLILLTSVLFVSCTSLGGYESGTIGGSTDLDVNQVGYQYIGALSIGGNYVNSDTKAKVVSNENGIIEVEVTGTVPPELIDLVESMPQVGPNGEVSLSGKFKNSTEGVAYVNSKGEKTLLVKYDCKVGDKWTYTTPKGTKFTREVISKSTEDDFFWSGMLIKVIEIEQDLHYPGFNKAVYRANHKWGLVNVDVFLEDGEKISMYF